MIPFFRTPMGKDSSTFTLFFDRKELFINLDSAQDTDEDRVAARWVIMHFNRGWPPFVCRPNLAACLCK